MNSDREERVPIVAVPGTTIGRNKAVVDRNLHKPQLNIFPENPSELDRDVHIGGGAKIGRIFGRKINVEKGTTARITEVASAVGLEEIVVEGYASINGPLLSSGKISVGPYTVVYGDIVGQEVFIQQKCVIKGNIISDGDLNVSSDARIFGIVYSRSGGVAICENSVVFDAIAQGDIVLGERSLLLDSVLWSAEGKIIANNTKMASFVDPKIAQANWDLYELAEGIESSRIDYTHSKHGTELNSGWVTVNDDLTRRNDLIELIKGLWTELYNISWEFFG